MKNHDATYWDLIAKNLSDNALPGEKESLVTWQSKSTGNRHILEEATGIWEASGKVKELEHYDTEQALNKVHSRLKNGAPAKQAGKIKLYYRSFIKIAATVVLALGLGMLGLYMGHQYPNQLVGDWKTVESQDEIITGINLPDGSNIDLNGHSRIVYRSGFAKNKRKLYLSGEAFFDVTENNDKPFIIVTDNINVKVLGTSFNVKAYKKDESARVAVKSGKVAISENAILKLSKQQVELAPGYKASYNGSQEKIKVEKYEQNNFLAWQTKDFTFNNTPLSEVSNLLESVYLVDIDIQNEEVKQLKLTASFQGQELELILRVIEKTFDLKVEKDQGRISLNK